MDKRDKIKAGKIMRIAVRLREKDFKYFKELLELLNEMAEGNHNKSGGVVISQSTLIRTLIMQGAVMDKKQLLKECLKHR